MAFWDSWFNDTKKLNAGSVDPRQTGQSLADDFGVGSGKGPIGKTAAMVAGQGGLLGGGQGTTTVTPYYAPPNFWGGYEGAADDWSKVGLDRMGQVSQGQQFAQEEMARFRGPQAVENQQLSDNEAWSRGYDQSGAIQLAREAAMGQSPSQAAYLMQHGLNQAVGQQEGFRNSGRGAAGIALANQNAAGNVANLQQNAYTQAGALRAQEMQNNMGLYGQLATQQREQDQNRLGMGNDMSKYNAGLNDQYKLGMGQLANQYNDAGVEWYKAAQQPQQGQAQANAGTNALNQSSYDNASGLAAGQNQAARDENQRNKDRLFGFIGTVGMGAGQIAANAYTGSRKKPV